MSDREAPITTGTDVANPHGLPTWARTSAGVQFADYPVRPGGRMPDFCIIGAAKCATTSLNGYLSQHPAIFMNPLKEPNYFSTDAHLARGDEWYMGQYADATPGQICGEASTSYTRHPVCRGTAARIARANPTMKLVYIVRSPVIRVQSECLQKMKHAKHVQGNDLTSLSLDEMLDLAQDPTSSVYLAPVATSQYRDQLREYEAHFPREQMHVVFYEEFAARPREVVAGILDFLGVDSGVHIDMSTRRNLTSTFTHSLAKERALKPLRRIPGFRTLRQLLPRKMRTELLETLTSYDREEDPRLSPERVRALEAHFAPHIEELETWLGRDLGKWWQTR
ncbi:sulfotransferase [Roseibacterium sp. SDUM158017]|uniref:sulfotransferase family protein n=1 Tax=Roseicyclus salinarum TaxID=3036773 RepID=UPI0024158F80|nr:sulfotransferase [Roseibacterium sp. SDUM158017]MDG4649620.1 sulfotransferase [Roseibacterium sp. SDUM158017]